MSNPCSNTFYACSEDRNNIEAIIKFFNEWPYSDVEDSGESVDIYFDSRWTFPEEEMKKLYESIPNKDDIYMRCLSVEYECMYHALWECDKEGWCEV